MLVNNKLAKPGDIRRVDLTTRYRPYLYKVNQYISGVLACMVGCFIHPEVAKEIDNLVINPSASGKEEREDA